MASTQALSAAAQDRKARLAQLKSLKRKQPDSQQESKEDSERPPKSPRNDTSADAVDVTSIYLSGRNYDTETKGPRLGFENAPSEGQETLERQAAALAAETKRVADEEEKADKPLDLFKLQPKKPNWDLKRDLERKLELLNVRTDNAVARLVRERIGNQQKAAQARVESANGGASAAAAAAVAAQTGDEGEVVGIDGATLVEATNVREREDEEETRREREEEEALLDAS